MKHKYKIGDWVSVSGVVSAPKGMVIETRPAIDGDPSYTVWTRGYGISLRLTNTCESFMSPLTVEPAEGAKYKVGDRVYTPSDPITDPPLVGRRKGNDPQIEKGGSNINMECDCYKCVWASKCNLAETQKKAYELLEKKKLLHGYGYCLVCMYRFRIAQLNAESHLSLYSKCADELEKTIRGNHKLMEMLEQLPKMNEKEKENGK